MSIIIKGMKMPKSCEECQVCDYEEGNCLLTGTNRISDGRNTLPHNGERRDWCPLIEIPPHGRLIDADELNRKMYHDAFETDSDMQKWDSGCWVRYKMFENNLRDAPTIIEAEEEE